MKRFPFLLLDAGPIIKLFELGVWDHFIKRCNVTVTKTVADEAKYARLEQKDLHINLEPYARDGRIKVIELELSVVRDFHTRFDPVYKAEIDPGEKETLAFLNSAKENWIVCSADGVVFRVLGLLGRAEQGISLQEILNETGLSQKLEWQYTREFRERYTHLGQRDSIQEKGLL